MSVNQSPAETYFERVLPRVSNFLPILLVPPICYLTLLPFSSVAGLTLGVTVSLATVAALWFAAPRITIDSEHLEVGNAVLPIRFVGRVEVIEAKDAFVERGINLSPAAYASFQPSVKSMVKIFVEDPEDPTPYWLVSSRRPQAIKALIEGLKAAS